MTEPDMVVGNHFNSYDHYMYINDFTCTIVECIYTTKTKITSENGKIIMDLYECSTNLPTIAPIIGKRVFQEIYH
jgi:hypothetical protein